MFWVAWMCDNSVICKKGSFQWEFLEKLIVYTKTQAVADAWEDRLLSVCFTVSFVSS